VSIGLEDISIRHDLRPGDLGYVIYRHGFVLTKEEPSSTFGKPVRMQGYELML